MTDNTKCIDCGVSKFQSDGRVSLTAIMHRHGFKYNQKIHIYIKKVVD